VSHNSKLKLAAENKACFCRQFAPSRHLGFSKGVILATTSAETYRITRSDKLNFDAAAKPGRIGISSPTFPSETL
jgi:hypothetical protein